MKQAIKMIVTLSLIGIISGGILALVNGWATPLIVENQKRATEQAIFQVQPDAKTYERVQNTDLEVYRVFNNDKKHIGYAMAYEGNGFQGKIRLMIGLTDDLKTITALEILEQVETPGLGSKVTGDWYKNQYKNLSAVPKVEWVKGAPPTKPNEIQAITGATISSKSVVAIVNDGISKLRNLEKQGG